MNTINPSPPTISILMSVYNTSENFLSQSISSVLSQSYPHFEFVVIDDGSTLPETVSCLNRFRDLDSRINIFRLDFNIGLTAALNLALSISTGDLIVRQDADDISHSDRLVKLLDFLYLNPSIKLVTSSFWTFSHNHLSPNRICNPNPSLLRFSNSLCHGSLAFTRKSISIIQGYNKNYILAQDYDLYLRYLKHRLPISVLDVPLYYLRHHNNSVSNRSRSKQHKYMLLAQFDSLFRLTSNRLLKFILLLYLEFRYYLFRFAYLIFRSLPFHGS